MITQVRTASVHDGKIQQAFEMAAKVTAYVNETFDVEMHVARNVGGSAYELHWIFSTESLAAWEDLWRRIEADEGYQELLGEIRQAGVFIGTSGTDRLYDVVV